MGCGAQNGVDRELRVNLGRAGEVTVVKTHCTKLEPLEELTMKTKTKALLTVKLNDDSNQWTILCSDGKREVKISFGK